MRASPQARGPARMRGGSRKLARIIFAGRANPARILRAYAGRAKAGRASPLCHP